MSNSPFVIIHQLIDPATGRTFKEGNLLLQHNIPIGTLVEVVPVRDDDEFAANDIADMDAGLTEDWRGVRMYVIAHYRDCDGTPLYVIGIKGNKWTGLDGGLGNRAWGGWSEGGLRVVNGG